MFEIPDQLWHAGSFLLVCDCDDPRGSSERNSFGIVTHGKIGGGCGLVRRTTIFECTGCEEIKVSARVTYAYPNRRHPNPDYYCDLCIEMLEL